MTTHDKPRQEHLAAELRARLQTDLGPYTRKMFEHALEKIPNGSELFLEALEGELARPADRLERELRNLHRNMYRETSNTGSRS